MKKDLSKKQVTESNSVQKSQGTSLTNKETQIKPVSTILNLHRWKLEKYSENQCW